MEILIINADPEFIKEVGVERLRAIAEVTAQFFDDQVQVSHALGMSGCMRWPKSMRPEVLVGYHPSELMR